MPRRTWILTAVEVEGPGGIESLLFSNRPYRPDAGPYADLPFLASWERRSAAQWTPKVNGMKAIGADLAVPIGLAGPELPPFVVANRKPYRTATSRELDYLFAAGYDLRGVVRQWAANGPPDGSAPTWADFGDPVFTGRMRKSPKRSDNGTQVSFFFDPTVGDLQPPLLTKTFTGLAGWVDCRELPIGGGVAPGFHSGDWSIQYYAGIQAPAAGQPPGFLGSILHIFGTVGLSLVGLSYVYRDGNNIKLRICYGGSELDYDGLFDTYTLYSVAGLDRTAMKFVTISWKESTGFLDVYVDGALVTTAAILNNMTRAQGAGIEVNLTQGAVGENLVRISALRLLKTGLGIDDQERVMDYAAYVGDLLNAWEFNEGVGSVMIDGVGEYDMIATVDRGSSLDGERDLAGAVIPAVFGTAFNVPCTQVDRRLDKAIIGVAVTEVQRVRSQGAALSTAESYSTNSFLINGNADTIRPAGTTPEIFGAKNVPGEQMNIDAGTFAGTFIVEDIVPPPFEAVRIVGSTFHHFKIKAENITPNLPASTQVTSITSSLPGRSWTDGRAEANPYQPAPNNQCKTVALFEELPDPVTADVIGDPAILAANPPGAGYVPPDGAENVILQAATRYAVNVPFHPVNYGLSGCRVGLYVGDTRSAADAVNEVAQGCLLWVEEDGTGTLDVRPWKFPEELAGPGLVITQGSVVEVSRAGRRDSGDRFEAVDGIRVLFNRSWVSTEGSNVPEVVDPATRSFISREWRTVNVGDITTAADIPEFKTLEVRRIPAKRLGEKVLRIAGGTQYTIRARWDRVGMLRDFRLGELVTGDLPAFGLPNMTGICTGYAQTPLAGVVTFNVWTESTP